MPVGEQAASQPSTAAPCIMCAPTQPPLPARPLDRRSAPSPLPLSSRAMASRPTTCLTCRCGPEGLSGRLAGCCGCSRAAGAGQQRSDAPVPRCLDASRRQRPPAHPSPALHRRPCGSRWPAGALTCRPAAWAPRSSASSRRVDPQWACPAVWGGWEGCMGPPVQGGLCSVRCCCSRPLLTARRWDPTEPRAPTLQPSAPAGAPALRGLPGRPV